MYRYYKMLTEIMKKAIIVQTKNIKFLKYYIIVFSNLKKIKNIKFEFEFVKTRKRIFTTVEHIFYYLHDSN